MPYSDFNPGGQAGDIVFTRGQGAVRLLQRTPGEPPSYAGHVAMLTSPSRCVEALTTVQAHSWMDDRRPCRVYRHRHWTPAQRQAVAAAMEGRLGRLYAPVKLILHAVDWALAWGRWALTLGLWSGEVVAARRLAVIDRMVICSQAVADSVAEGAGYHFGTDPNAANPDSMEDWCRQHPQDWELVHERAA